MHIDFCTIYEVDRCIVLQVNTLYFRTAWIEHVSQFVQTRVLQSASK